MPFYRQGILLVLVCCPRNSRYLLLRGQDTKTRPAFFYRGLKHVIRRAAGDAHSIAFPHSAKNGTGPTTRNLGIKRRKIQAVARH